MELAGEARAAQPEVARVAELVVAQAAGAEREGALAREPVAARRRGWRRRRRNLASHGYSAGGPYNVRRWTGLGQEEAQVPSETQQRSP